MFKLGTNTTLRKQCFPNNCSLLESLSERVVDSRTINHFKSELEKDWGGSRPKEDGDTLYCVQVTCTLAV